jgi:hypothetical protein
MGEEGGQGQGARAKQAQPGSVHFVSLRHQYPDFAMIPRRCQSASFFSKWMCLPCILGFFGPHEEVLLEFLYNSLLRL